MASRLLARRKQQLKKATTLVSKQSLESAIQEAEALVEELLTADTNDGRLDQLEESISFLTSILRKTPLDMQQEGASSLEDYLDDAVMPEMAEKIRQDVNMIAEMKNTSAKPVPTLASGSDAWVDDRDEKGEPKVPVQASGSDNWISDRVDDEPKEPDLAEVPRLAHSKEATGEMTSVDPEEYSTHFAIAKALGGEVKPFDVYQGPYISIGGDVRVSDALTDPDANGPYAMAPRIKGLVRLWISVDENDDLCHVYNEDNEKVSTIGFPYEDENMAIAAAEEVLDKSPETPEAPRLASKNADLFYGKSAAPVAAPAAPAAAPKVPKPSADITQLSSDTLAKMQKALAGSEDLMNDKAAQAFIAAIAEELMNRPVEVEQEQAPAPAAPVPVAASFGGLNIASAQGGSWFVTDKDSGTIKEDGGRTPEIGEAHSKLDDNTGIKRPATELPSKFATEWECKNCDHTKEQHKGGKCELSPENCDCTKWEKISSSKTASGEMTTNKAVKLTERMGEQLKALYLEAKPATEVLDSRPVREAIEAIYRAYDMMGEAAKVLNKLYMQEQAEEQATAVKEKNKKSSLLGGLTIASEDEDDEV
jgi:hypothetical protein